MKPKYLQFITAALLLFVSIIPAKAQNGLDYITISGEVRDADTNKKLENVIIAVSSTNITTITNADGVFSIKVKKSLGATKLVFSHVGYISQEFAITNNDMRNVKITLHSIEYSIEGAVVGTEALALVKKAIERIGDNYSPKTNMLTGFYRETIKKRNSYINISEAITYSYKTSYSQERGNDRVQIFKGRQLLSPKASDTLIVKLQGGPTTSVYLDAVRTWDLLTDPGVLYLYKFSLSGSVMIDGRPHYIVNFRPQVIVSYALLYGKLYIDEETLTFTKVEANLSMDDENKATQVMLKKKPYGLRFKPEGLSYEVTYKRQGHVSYLNYMRTELTFKCDWKRKIFRSNYLIVAEMVITDINDQDVEKIPARLAFNEKHSLSDKVANFYDENFWEDFNIIEPTESLESAVNKLRKKVKQ
ncbi:MAG: carboxypeptidase-like regulatory domain-containing protein [Prevotellaceae bacterium]|jgi:hypothetical protein|nr:carboxypeptidase-like regulatory domain-containing protein [Prevotellaceae bacterium]